MWSMSVNCIRCVKRARSGSDLLCDFCRIDNAVAVLNRSRRGQQVMDDLLTMFDNGGLSLDQNGQIALFNLLTMAYEKPGSVLDAMSHRSLATGGV
jgi:hypothetical protein